MTRRTGSQSGFSLPEIMIGSLVLIVGVLGVATLTDAAGRLALTADHRSAATAIGRSVAETARRLTTAQLAPQVLVDSLRAATPNLPDSRPGDGRWTVRRGGTDYLITATTCTVDNASDGYAPASYRDASYCAQPAATAPPDLQPDDHRRVELMVSAGPRSVVRQVVDVPSGLASSLPLIAGLQMREGAEACTTNCVAITSAHQTAAVFDAQTLNHPAAVEWLVDGGVVSGCPPAGPDCAGSDNRWTFTWNLGTPAMSNGLCLPGAYRPDGAYQVGVQGLDRSGAAGGRAAISVRLDRCPGGTPPPGVNATGRDGNGPVDVEWQRNPEGDLAGYRVYRIAGGTRTPVCPASLANDALLPLDSPAECLDAAAPSYGGSLQYAVYPLDRDPAGQLREGTPARQSVNTGNRAPNPPLALTASRVGADVTLTWAMPAIQDLDPGDAVHSFRIYRRDGSVSGAPALTDRVDRDSVPALCVAGTCRWTAPAARLGTYWVTSVDTHLRESTPAGTAKA